MKEHQDDVVWLKSNIITSSVGSLCFGFSHTLGRVVCLGNTLSIWPSSSLKVLKLWYTWQSVCTSLPSDWTITPAGAEYWQCQILVETLTEHMIQPSPPRDAISRKVPKQLNFIMCLGIIVHGMLESFFLVRAYRQNLDDIALPHESCSFPEREGLAAIFPRCLWPHYSRYHNLLLVITV